MVLLVHSVQLVHKVQPVYLVIYSIHQQLQLIQ